MAVFRVKTEMKAKYEQKSQKRSLAKNVRNGALSHVTRAFTDQMCSFRAAYREDARLFAVADGARRS